MFLKNLNFQPPNQILKSSWLRNAGHGIARPNLYTRLKDLGIEPEKEGKRAYVNASQLQLLDALHSHLQKGGITSEFLKQRESEPSRQNQALVAESTEQISLFQPSALVAVVETIVKRLVPTTGSRLSYLREARRGKWKRMAAQYFRSGFSVGAVS